MGRCGARQQFSVRYVMDHGRSHSRLAHTTGRGRVGMDNLLQEHEILHYRFFLGEVDISHLVQGRTHPIMRLTLSGPGGS